VRETGSHISNKTERHGAGLGRVVVLAVVILAALGLIAWWVTR
jgi:hypothetical protein